MDVTHLHLEAVRELAGRARGQVIDLVSGYEDESQSAPAALPEASAHSSYNSTKEVRTEGEQVDAGVHDEQSSSDLPDDATKHAEPTAPAAGDQVPEPGPRRRVKRRI